MKRISVIFGTRPEFIKLAPLIKELKQLDDIKLQIISTNQHPDLLENQFKQENIFPTHSLEIKRNSDSLNELQQVIMSQLQALALKDSRPDIVIVHGDTATSYAGSLFAFHNKIPIAHIEAGLRSYNLNSPFPEEFYRQSISKMASLNFVPTKKEFLNLIDEKISAQKIIISGNTIVDAVRAKVRRDMVMRNQVLISLHRRETRSKLEDYLKHLNQLAQDYSEVQFKFMLHPSLKLINMSAYQHLDLIAPLSHKEFINELACSRLYISDSGGGQEEANLLGVKTLLVREHTEREDGLDSIIRLIGTDPDSLALEVMDELSQTLEKNKMNFKSKFPSKMIANNLDSYLQDSIASKAS